MQTPLTAQLLSQIATDLGWTQNTIEAQTGIVQSTVTRQLRNERPVRDEHLAAYIKAVPSLDKPKLLAAWLRDVIGADDLEFILDPNSGKLRQEAVDWLPALPDESRKSLQWLATAMLRAPDLQETITSLVGHLGYKPAKEA